MAGLLAIGRGLLMGLGLAGAYAGGALMRGRARVLSGRARHVRRALKRVAERGVR